MIYKYLNNLEFLGETSSGLVYSLFCLFLDLVYQCFVQEFNICVSNDVKMIFSQILVVVFWYWNFAAQDLGGVYSFLSPGWSCAVCRWGAVRGMERPVKVLTVWFVLKTAGRDSSQGAEGVQVNQPWHQVITAFFSWGAALSSTLNSLGSQHSWSEDHPFMVTPMREAPVVEALPAGQFKVITSLFLSHSPLNDHCLWLNREFPHWCLSTSSTVDAFWQAS